MQVSVFLVDDTTYRRPRSYVGCDTRKRSDRDQHHRTPGRLLKRALVPRGGLLALLFPIPPATITFHGTAVVHAPGAPEVRPALAKLKRLLPPESAQSTCLIEITPEGEFLTYGIGVSLMAMRDPAAAGARVPVA